MKFRGREIDPIRLWDQYVELPPKVDDREIFLPLVRCPNPDHDTLKRHFQINVRDGLVHCFAQCGISGSYVHAISVIERLYDKFQVEGAKDERERKRRIARAHREAAKIAFGYSRRPSAVRSVRKSRGRTTAAVPLVDLSGYKMFLPVVAQRFLRERDISSESVAKWRLGWDPGEARLVIPARDENDVLRFLIKRAVRDGDWPKYLYSAGFPKNSLLFGACFFDPGMVRSFGVVLVEGSFDTIRNHENGLTTTGGILGTGISDQQVKIISRLRPKKIYLMFDRDVAGVRNIDIACRKLSHYPLFICRYPRRKFDPAELTAKEAHRSIAGAVSATRWKADVSRMTTTTER
jgi:DNA primase